MTRLFGFITVKKNFFQCPFFRFTICYPTLPVIHNRKPSNVCIKPVPIWSPEGLKKNICSYNHLLCRAWKQQKIFFISCLLTCPLVIPFLFHYSLFVFLFSKLTALFCHARTCLQVLVWYLISYFPEASSNFCST